MGFSFAWFCSQVYMIWQHVTSVQAEQDALVWLWEGLAQLAQLAQFPAVCSSWDILLERHLLVLLVPIHQRLAQDSGRRGEILASGGGANEGRNHLTSHRHWQPPMGRAPPLDMFQLQVERNSAVSGAWECGSWNQLPSTTIVITVITFAHISQLGTNHRDTTINYHQVR